MVLFVYSFVAWLVYLLCLTGLLVGLLGSLFTLFCFVLLIFHLTGLLYNSFVNLLVVRSVGRLVGWFACSFVCLLFYWFALRLESLFFDG